MKRMMCALSQEKEVLVEHKITIHDYTMGRDMKYPFPEEVRQNAEYTVKKVNELISFLQHFDVPLEPSPKTKSLVSSGWRPPEINKATAGAAPKSKHITGCACDLYDPDGVIDTFLMENPNILADLDLYMEHPSATKGWCHVQTVPPASKRIVFYP